MTQFHEGQEVEITESWGPNPVYWRRAKIIGLAADQSKYSRGLWYVGAFPDDSRGVFDADHIRRTLYDQRNDGAVFANLKLKCEFRHGGLVPSLRSP